MSHLFEHGESGGPPISDHQHASRKIKVCHVVATTEGAPWMFEQLRDLRDRHGMDVHAVVSGHEGGLVDKLRAAGIPYHVSDFGSGAPQRVVGMVVAILKLALLFRRERFDVVQTHIFLSMLTGRPAAWLADVPVRLAMIAGPFHLQAHTSRWIERSTYWMDTTLIPSCEKSLQLCRAMGIRDERLSLIHYSVDEEKFDPALTLPANIRAELGLPPDAPLICMIAFFYPPLPSNSWIPVDVRGHAVKGHEDLVRAAPVVLSEFPKAKFLLVGSGWGPQGEAYMEEVKELVSRMNLQESIIFAGYRADVNNILREADVAVQASLNENLGGTIEALMMERPMVATRVGGMVDSVLDGETGVLVNASSPDDLARGIIELLRDPARAGALGRAGRKLMLDQFSLRKTVSDFEQLYSGLLRRETQRRRRYNLLISLCRLMLAVPIFFYFSIRLILMDMFFPVYLPNYLSRIKHLIRRLLSLALALLAKINPQWARRVRRARYD